MSHRAPGWGPGPICSENRYQWEMQMEAEAFWEEARWLGSIQIWGAMKAERERFALLPRTEYHEKSETNAQGSVELAGEHNGDGGDKAVQMHEADQGAVDGGAEVNDDPEVSEHPGGIDIHGATGHRGFGETGVRFGDDWENVCRGGVLGGGDVRHVSDHDEIQMPSRTTAVWACQGVGRRIARSLLDGGEHSARRTVGHHAKPSAYQVVERRWRAARPQCPLPMRGNALRDIGAE